MTDILLIRHGETEWNFERRLQGHLDIPLNRHGREQAASLAFALRSERFDAIIASDLQRALDTAQAVAALHGLTVTTDADLRERCFGGFEGLRYDEIGGHFPVAYQAWHAREIDARFPPGERVAETLREFSARSLACVIGHAQAHRDQKIAIFTHGGVLDCVYRSACGILLDKARDFDIMNTAVNRFSWDGSVLKLRVWGDVSHLGQRALDELVQ